MTTAKIIINGKKIEVQLTDEQAQELTAQKKVTGFERVKHNEMYFCTDSGSNFVHDFEYGGSTDQLRYENANYYTDESLAEWCIRNDTLNRKMRRWAAEHNTRIINWGGETVERWCLLYNFILQKIITRALNRELHPFEIYFSTREIAEEAIEVFGDEVKWLVENRPKWF